MGLGKLMNRSTELVVSDTVTGVSNTFTIVDNIAPDWGSITWYGEALQIPGAWRAATMLADLVGQCPFDAYRELADRPIEKLATPPLLEQPAPPVTRMETFSSMFLDYLMCGNAVGIIAARNAQGYPTAIYPVPSRIVQVRRVYSYLNSNLPIGALEYHIGTLGGLGSDDLIHIKGPLAPGGLRGMGVLETQLMTLMTASQQQRQAQSVAKHGVPTGVLTTTNEDTTSDDAAKAKASWIAAQQTAGVAALAPGMDFKPLSWNPEQAQMIQARQFSLTELELIFGLPVGWLGGQTSSRTYSNIEQDAVNLIKFTLAGHLARFEQALSLCFPRGTYVKANLDAVLRSDTMTRYQSHAIGLSSGFLTLDEVREMENRPPLPGIEPADELPPEAAAAGATDPAALAADALDDLNEIDPMEEVN